MGLYREIGLTASAFLVIGNIIGIGIFTTTGLIAGEVSNSPWLIGVWLLGGMLALIGAVCYARLGVLYPKAGGEYAFLRPTFGPFPAFLSGWASLFIGFTAPIAASALGLSHYLSPYLGIDPEASPLPLKLTAIIALLLVNVLLSFGLKFGNRLHAFVTIINLILVTFFALAVLWRSPIETNLPAALAGGLFDVPLPSLASAVILVMFTYSGWNAAAYIAEEIQEPGRNIPRSLILGTLLVVVLYCLINLAYLSAAPLSELAGQVAVAEVAGASVLGSGSSNLVNLLILFSILSSLSAMSIAGPRVYFAMSRDGLFPGWLSDVHPVRKIPARAIWFQTGIAILFITFGSFYQILLYSGFVLILFSTLTVAGLFKVSRGGFLPAVFVLINTLILINSTVSYPREAAAGLATVAAGIPVYWIYRRKVSL